MMWFGLADLWYNFRDWLSWTPFGEFYRGIRDWTYSFRYVFTDIPERLGLTKILVYSLFFCLFLFLGIISWLRLFQWLALLGILVTIGVFIWDVCRTRYIPGLMDWRSLRPSVRQLHEHLSRLAALEEVLLKLETCDPQNVGEVVHTEWQTIGDDERKDLSFLLNGVDDVEYWRGYLSRKQADLLPPIDDLTAEIEEWRRRNVDESLLPEEGRGEADDDWREEQEDGNGVEKETEQLPERELPHVPGGLVFRLMWNTADGQEHQQDFSDFSEMLREYDRLEKIVDHYRMEIPGADVCWTDWEVKSNDKEAVRAFWKSCYPRLTKTVLNTLTETRASRSASGAAQ